MLMQISFDMIKRGVFENPSWDWSNTLVLTFAGFFIVFLVLLLLIIVFTIFGKVMQKVNKKNAKNAPAVTEAPKSADGGVDDETAAVITAAITQASGGKKFIIKDIKEAKK